MGLWTKRTFTTCSPHWVSRSVSWDSVYFSMRWPDMSVRSCKQFCTSFMWVCTYIVCCLKTNSPSKHILFFISCYCHSYLKHFCSWNPWDLSLNPLYLCLLKGKNPTEEYLEAMMMEAPGPINFTMFLTMFGEKLNGTDPEDVIRNAFACFDEEGTGKFLLLFVISFFLMDA